MPWLRALPTCPLGGQLRSRPWGAAPRFPPGPGRGPGFLWKKAGGKNTRAPPWTRVYGPLAAARSFWGSLSLVRLRGYFLRDAKTDLGRIFEGNYAGKHFCERRFPTRSAVPPRPKAFPLGGRWAGEAGSDEGATLYPTFPCRKGEAPNCRPNRSFLLPRWATRSPPHQSPPVTASPQGEAYGLCSPTRKSVPNQGTYMGTVIAQPPEQCGTIAKTSESERALNQGGRGATPRDSLRPGFLLEKAWIPRPGPGGEPPRRSGPAPVQQEPPAGGTPRRQNSILCLQGRIPCAMITENMAILYKRNPAGGPPADKGSILWKSMVWRSNSTCDTAK